MEASKEKRAEYEELIKDIPPQSLVYIDESGIELTICKDRGWGKKSEKLVGKKSGKYYERTNVIGGYVNNKSIAPMVFNGSCNTKLFEAWVEQFLIKELKLYIKRATTSTFGFSIGVNESEARLKIFLNIIHFCAKQINQRFRVY